MVKDLNPKCGGEGSSPHTCKLLVLDYLAW
jgi:hypothetical protein